MPFFLYLVRYYYIFLTALVILVPLKYDIFHFMPSLFIMWSSYFLFKRGVYSKLYNFSQIVKDYQEGENSDDILINRLFFYFTLFLCLFIPMYIQFYTGGSIINAFFSFSISTGSDSNYGLYQQYFADNNLGAFSLDKLPYIIFNGLSKVIFWFYCLYYMVYSTNVSKIQKVCFIIIYLLFFLSGVSRGTSFENFELLVITIFCILAGQKNKYGEDMLSHKQLFVLGSLIVFAGAYFVFSKALRYDDFSSVALHGPSSTLVYDQNSWIMSMFPILGEATLNFSGYFIFPLYFTSELFWKLSFNSLEGLISLLFPIIAPLTYDDPTAYRSTLEHLGVDCGACWNPDVTTFIYYLGLPLYFFSSYLFGKLAAIQYIKGILDKNIANMLFLFIITYEMLSLPVGNFIVISSANKISLLVIVYLVKSAKFKRFMQR